MNCCSYYGHNKIYTLDTLWKIFMNIFIKTEPKIKFLLLRNWTEIHKMLLQRTYSLAVFEKRVFIIIEYIQNEYLKRCSINRSFDKLSKLISANLSFRNWHSLTGFRHLVWAPELWLTWTIWIPDNPKHFPIRHPCPYHLPSCPSSLFDSYSFCQSFLQCPLLPSRPVSIF